MTPVVATRLRLVALALGAIGGAVLVRTVLADSAAEDGPVLPSAFVDGRLVVPQGLPSPWVPPSNPITAEKIALGRKLFVEKALSRDGTKSCMSCHDPAKALTDGRATAIGVREQVGPRNVPSLWNAATYPTLFWDGRAVSLEAQAEGPLLAPTELDMTEDLLVDRIAKDPAYAPLFERAFGTKTVTLRRVAYALASFQRTLLAGDAPFDRWWFGHDEAAVSPAVRRGYLVFRTKGACAGCHAVHPAEASFTDFEFHATGTSVEGATDLGRFAITGREEDRGRFRTPTLRNVARTAPYFHDGSAATLDDVIRHYDEGGKTVAGRRPEIDPLHLTPEEKSDLRAFLESLTSPAVAPPLPPAPPAPPAAGPEAAASPPAKATRIALPDDASDARALRVAAEDALEAHPTDAEALRALLVAVTRLDDRDLLDDAIDRARAPAASDPALRGALGVALVHRARQGDAPDATRLREAATLLAPDEGPAGDARRALELAYARHLLGEAEAAARAYERALDAGEATADLAMRGLYSLASADDVVFLATLERLATRRPKDATLLRWRAERLRASRPEEALTLLFAHREVVESSPRACLALAGLLRSFDRHAEADVLERLALARGAGDATILGGVEALWREARPLASFEDADALDADFRDLFARAATRPDLGLAFRNDLAFRFREICATYAWRGEGRTQGLAEGAPAAARRLLDRVVALYEEAVALLPKDALDRPFDARWTYASVLNDAALMRHYWTDVRDLDRAEALYLRAFELTDGAYMDTYDYNLQYLYGIERPGSEERWFRVARKAATSILKEAPGGGYAPDERKREAARKDADALRRLLEERAAAKAPPK